MSIRYLTPDYAVAPQLSAADMATAAQMGFKTVINNRPDREAVAEGSPHSEMEQAARAAGLHYVFLPVDSAVTDPTAPGKLAELLPDLPRPILAYCRSGSRSGRLYSLARALGQT